MRRYKNYAYLAIPVAAVIAPRAMNAIWYEWRDPLLMCPKPYIMRLPNILTQPTLENQTARCVNSVSVFRTVDILVSRTPCSWRLYHI